MSKELNDEREKQEKEDKKARKEAKREKKRMADEAAATMTESVQPLEEVAVKEPKETKKSKKRKLEDAVAEEPKKKKKSKKVKDGYEAMEDAVVAPVEVVKESKKPKKSKKIKGDDKIGDDAAMAPAEPVDEPKKSKTSKKRKLEADTSGVEDEVPKAELKALKKKAKREGKDPKGASGAEPREAPADDDADADAPAKKNQRFIVFIGNLPYTATEESIKKHFIKIRPTSVRPRKGYAFMDFNNYDRMKTCLKLYHHTEFDDGTSPARQINVELTSGGGGNSANRKSKIDAKNERLNEQRERRKIEEQRQKDEGESKVHGTHLAKKMERLQEKKPEKTPEKKLVKPKGEAHAGIHPSRLGRLQF